MVKKHQIGDVIWFTFKTSVAFTLEELLLSLSKKEKELCLILLN